MIELVRVRRALQNTVIELGGDGIRSGLVRGADDRETIAATLSFVIEGLRFEARVALLRGRH